MPNIKRNVSVEMWDILRKILGNFSTKVRITFDKNILFFARFYCEKTIKKSGASFFLKKVDK